MITLRDEDIDFILEDIRSRGIRSENLQQSLLDHICSILENELGQDADFLSSYQRIIQTFYKDDLREIEEQTIFLQRFRHHIALSRTWFFCLLFALVIGPFIGYDAVWLAEHYHVSGWHIPIGIWGATLVFPLFPLGILLVLLLTPNRLDPLIPRRAVILLGFHPLITILPCPDEKNDVV